MHTVHRRETVVRISTELQWEEGKREKSVCALCLCKEKGEAGGVHKKRFVLSSSFPHHCFPHQTPHSTPEANPPAAGYGLCRVNSNAITHHSTHLQSPRQKPPWRVVCGMAQWGMVSLDLRAVLQLQHQQCPIEGDAKESIGIVFFSQGIPQIDPVALAKDV